MSQPPFDFLGQRMDQCVNHAQVQASHVCGQCQAAICAVCDFLFPGDVHLCPKCATSTAARPLSSSRKTMLGVSFVAAVLTTFLLAACLTGVFVGATDPVIGFLVGLILLGSALLGLGMSLACLDGRAGNPTACWVSVALNAVLAVAWLGLVILGNLAG